MAKRIPELDGLRGLAVLFVLIAHYFGETPHGLNALTWGWIGVGLFFTLSGYLIGTIILDGHDKPGFVLTFYKQRAARILPAYAVWVTTVLIVSASLAGYPWVDRPLPWIAYATFTQNFAIATAVEGGSWLLPTWTLAVEQQFYLLIPLLIMVTPRRKLLTIMVALWLSAILFRLVVYDLNKLAALTLLPSRADLLLSGVIAAMIDRRFALGRHLLALRLTPLIATLLLLAVSLADKGRTLSIVSPALLGIGGGGLILCLVHHAPEASRFRSPTLYFFGQISYALYLIHQPVSGLLHGFLLGSRPDIATPLQWAVSLLAAAVSIGLAHLSWRFIEEPVLRFAKDQRTSRSSDAAATQVQPSP